MAGANGADNDIESAASAPLHSFRIFHSLGKFFFIYAVANLGPCQKRECISILAEVPAGGNWNLAAMPGFIDVKMHIYRSA